MYRHLQTAIKIVEKQSTNWANTRWTAGATNFQQVWAICFWNSYPNAPCKTGIVTPASTRKKSYINWANLGECLPPHGALPSRKPRSCNLKKHPNMKGKIISQHFCRCYVSFRVDRRGRDGWGWWGRGERVVARDTFLKGFPHSHFAKLERQTHPNKSRDPFQIFSATTSTTIYIYIYI